ncbi:MAG TPA: hypothetical protein VEM39_06075 [Myxococcaceae bacterium]|nr:hypothetical protein [Myxococcaceae bacterium]
MIRNRPSIATVAVLGLLAAGCGGDNSLGGSVSELFPLDVSRVEVRRNAEAVQVSYYNNRGADIDLVARVTVAMQGIDYRQGRKIDLSGEYQPGHLRTSVIHLAWGEPPRNFPPVKRGDLVISSGGNPGEGTRGNFSMSFDQGGDIGAGRTLYGSFSSTALDGGFGP